MKILLNQQGLNKMILSQFMIIKNQQMKSYQILNKMILSQFMITKNTLI